MPEKDGQSKRERLARQYGFVQAFFDTDPELKQLFDLAVKKTWTPERFVAELRDTKWFKKNAVSVRNAILQETADPATYKQRVQQMTATVVDTWGATFGATMDRDEIKQWAETAYRMGWSEAQLVDHMTRSVNYRKLLRNKQLGGTAQETKTKLEALGRAYGLNPGNKFLANQVERIVEGRDTFEAAAARLKDWAKREYKAYAAELDGGATMEEIAAPYVNRMAELLELNPETVNVQRKLIQKALRNRNEKGETVPMGLDDFEDMIRKDRRWQYTENAREQAMSVTEGLLRDFGILA